MDIAYYISDLLGQQGELTVPNLGYFVQIRMPAYFNRDERKFYPPHYSVQFDPQVIDDDDALANHITAVKKISVTSAKYFIEKYISNLKSQAFIEDVPFANLGSFTSDGSRLTFNTQTKTDDPTFFAYPSVDAAKIGDAPIKRTTIITEPEVAAPVVSAPAYTAPPVVETYIAPEPVVKPEPVYVPEPAYVAPQPVAETQVDLPPNTPFFGGELVSSRVNPEENLEEPKRLGIWIIVAIVFTVLIIGLGALYKFKPGLFQKKYTAPAATKPAPAIKDTTPLTPVNQTPAGTDSTGKADSAGLSTKGATQPVTKTTLNTKDTAKVGNFSTIKTKPTPVEPVKTPVTTAVASNDIPAGINNPMPEIVPKGADMITAGAFAKPNKARALARIAELKKLGFTDARLVTDKIGEGDNYKVILGVYKTKDDARAAKKYFMASGKFKSDKDISVEKNLKSYE